MELIRWNPRRDFFNWPVRMNRLFEDFFQPTVFSGEETAPWNWQPTADLYETDNQFVITAELPGVDKKDIGVDVKGRVLTLSGERSSENEVKEKNYHHEERIYGKFERSFTLPADVDPDKVKADYKDGILKIEIPKPEGRKPKQITVH